MSDNRNPCSYSPTSNDAQDWICQNEDDDSDNENNVRLKDAYKKIVETLDANTVICHMSVYRYLQQETPYLMDLICNKEHQTQAVLIREMQNIINHTHSDDASHLCPVISSYAVPDPERKALDPPVQPGITKDRLGFNHPKLASLLCPICHLQEMLDNPVETRKRIASGNIKVTVQKNPAFLYEGDIVGKNFDPEDVIAGFMRRYLLECVMKHIFTSPSSALTTLKTNNTRSSNSKLHNMRQVEANHIAYAATHARFSICSQARFVDLDADFKLPDFYYRIATFIADEISEDWSNDLYAHYNKLLFSNPRGLGCTMDDANEPSDEDDIAIMKKQMVSRANDLSSQSRASTAVEEPLRLV
ncbi:hypothetical protein HD554DRAFT_2041683 [Boletus coccyginus]|nr:hypothetical protein HD554DRAFT_2041683 [Boletus coccyginus]